MPALQLKRGVCVSFCKKSSASINQMRAMLLQRAYTLLYIIWKILPLERVANGEMPCKAVSERVEVEISVLAGLVGSVQS